MSHAFELPAGEADSLVATLEIDAGAALDDEHDVTVRQLEQLLFANTLAKIIGGEWTEEVDPADEIARKARYRAFGEIAARAGVEDTRHRQSSTVHIATVGALYAGQRPSEARRGRRDPDVEVTDETLVRDAIAWWRRAFPRAKTGQTLDDIEPVVKPAADTPTEQEPRHTADQASPALTTPEPPRIEYDRQIEDAVRLAVTGDKQAVDRLLTLCRPLVVRYCRNRLSVETSGPFAADDVAQETLLATLSALTSGGYRLQGKPFMAFVYGIAAHKLIDFHRARGRNRMDLVAEIPDMPSQGNPAEQHVLDLELNAEVSRMLEQLPEKQREIIVCRILLGMSAEETAATVGSTPGAVRVGQHRAMARLRRIAPGYAPGASDPTSQEPQVASSTWRHRRR